MFQALGHLALKLLQDAIHYICVLSPLGARSLLCASGDIGSSTDLRNAHRPAFHPFCEMRRGPASHEDIHRHGHSMDK